MPGTWTSGLCAIIYLWNLDPNAKLYYQLLKIYNVNLFLSNQYHMSIKKKAHFRYSNLIFYSNKSHQNQLPVLRGNCGVVERELWSQVGQPSYSSPDYLWSWIHNKLCPGILTKKGSESTAQHWIDSRCVTAHQLQPWVITVLLLLWLKRPFLSNFYLICRLSAWTVLPGNPSLTVCRLS